MIPSFVSPPRVARGMRALLALSAVSALLGARGASAQAAKSAASAGKYLADIYALARLRLQAAGVREIHGGGLCTVGDTASYFSYRRDRVCGRMASLIWLEP